MIGNDVIVTVLGVKGRQVRIGITAPKHIGVHREEVYRLIQDQDCESEEILDDGTQMTPVIVTSTAA